MTLDNIKAKGDELVRNFKGVHSGIGMIEKQAVYCSIIAVEEIIKDEKYILSICHPNDEEMILDQIKFWNEVLNYLKINP